MGFKILKTLLEKSIFDSHIPYYIDLREDTIYIDEKAISSLSDKQIKNFLKEISKAYRNILKEYPQIKNVEYLLFSRFSWGVMITPIKKIGEKMNICFGPEIKVLKDGRICCSHNK